MAINDVGDYLLPTPEETEAAAAIADGRVPRISFAAPAEVIDPFTQTAQNPTPSAPEPITIETFFESAESKGFTPVVVTFREGGFPARDLQTERRTLYPKGASLILGVNIPGTCTF